MAVGHVILRRDSVHSLRGCFSDTRPVSLQTHGENRNSLVAFSGDPRYGTATERLPSVAVRNANNTGKITGWYRKLF
jgi:hypothetical protein